VTEDAGAVTDGAVGVRVDGAKCQGHNRCMAICPEVFEADDLGYAVVRMDRVGRDLAEKARLAEANCPERAITVA
jgi:ferredoxin